ncbi:hypothetical protein SLEP1_g25722 [Rubroshorea leprosula]|uniref:Uncharacterized protein n=1 Tax=Rubroshorea leprosula TaxID=152421 RepID=A0AAV5JVM5_9ROSI|nr:hypothetical protein SLEP1_g25722 [Rubroshorea leprosula]
MNKISCQIHKWEIEGMSLSRLNLSYNFLTGIDLFAFENVIRVDLSSNLLQGSLPILSTAWDVMQLFISGNNLTSEIPSSYCNFTSLRVLVLANNSLEEKLQNVLETLVISTSRFTDEQVSWLKVLILQSIHCAINNSMLAFYFSKLRIIDDSQNDSMGLLPSNYFKNLIGMRDVHEDEAELEYVGHIPEELEELKSLHFLNLSHNNLIGQIPSSLGKMTELESLDPSSNKLEGWIPEQLTSSIFLSVLNLSHNKLEGDIPQGKQFNTFSNTSYIGNSGLCGFPLTKKCHNEEELGAPQSKFDEEDDFAALFEWKFALASDRERERSGNWISAGPPNFLSE